MTRARAATTATIALALIGLATSVALAVDQLGPAPAYCAEGGCATVQASEWARPLGVPTPVLGAVFFAVVLWLAAMPLRRAAVRRAWSVAGGVAAIGFLLLQGVVIGAWCRLCIVADGAALAIGVLAFAPIAPVGRAGASVIAALGAVAFAAPITVAALVRAPAPVVTRAPLPDVVAREQRPGALTIVEFVDFECPFCRALHGRLASAIDKADRPVRIVRKMVPLKIHAGALPAALAWCSADAQGKGDAMADALIAAAPAELTPAGCERIAAQIGLDLAAYRATSVAPATRARIDADTADARAAGVKLLPTVYVGPTPFAGADATEAELVAALNGT